MLLWLSFMLSCVTCITCINYITEDTTYRLRNSPILITEDTIIKKDKTLTIEPGVEVRVAPGVFMGFNGTLDAQGTESRRIKFTKDPSVGIDGTTKWPSKIRLVDEPTVMEGRLQIYYRNHWRGICANSVNWTDVDVNVTCQELGFAGGMFNFFSWARNDSRFMLVYKPDCQGGEARLMDCPGSQNAKIGSRICEHQQTIHLKCFGVKPGMAEGHWSGLEFFNSTTKRILPEDAIQVNSSASIMKFVDIEYAGVTPFGEPISALRADPYAPLMYNVHISNSALDGTNFTNLKSWTIIEDSYIHDNRGNGLNIESHYGRISIKNSEIANNFGNGIKTKLIDGKYYAPDISETFCDWQMPEAQFPIVLSAVPLKGFETYTECARIFTTLRGQVLTLNFLEMEIEDAASANITVYDGELAYLPNLIEKYTIVNNTIPQGVTTTLNKMRVVFEWEKPPGQYCPSHQDCVQFTIMVDSGRSTIPEIFINNTQIHNNTQHGIYLENPRNYAFVNHSILSDNGYGAGLRVFGGAADIHVNASKLEFNQDNGINITYDGGYRIFNHSSFSFNYGNGINITFNETTVDNKTRLAKHQRTEVFRCEFLENDESGVRVGNFCRSIESHRLGNLCPVQGECRLHKAVVNASTFIGNGRDGIEFESCYVKINDSDELANYTAGYNVFRRNSGHAIKMQPLLNAIGQLRYNEFTDHVRHTILIDNGEHFLEAKLWSPMEVTYEISNNTFRDNSGYYIAHFRLTEGSQVQSLIFIHNELTDNVIEGGSAVLNERTRAFAVIVVSSSNVNISRNLLINSESRYELATHLRDRSVELACARQWWGTTDYSRIIMKIFDQYSRYDLAKIQYHPALKYGDLSWHATTHEERPHEIEFSRPGNRLGGRLPWIATADNFRHYRTFTTEPGETYYVDRDITVLPDGELHISPGTVLEFENGIGMLIQGYFTAVGQENNKIEFVLKNETTYTEHPLVRLVDGITEYEGRVEIRLENHNESEWGTICDKGWTLTDASVICQMLGYVVHPDDWQVFLDDQAYSSQPIWRSQVQCTDLDNDITKCAADGPDDHSCDHSRDVGVKCHSPTWAGIHFLTTARPGRIEHAVITEAGLKDPTALLYSPAIHIDYNVHTLQHLHISNIMSDGILIMHNDAYANAAIRHSTISNNMGHGVSTRGPYFEVEFCDIFENTMAGVEYNPYYSTYEARQMRAGIHNPYVFNDNSLKSINLVREDFAFVVTEEITGPLRRPQSYEIEIEVDANHNIVADIIDYNPDTTQEKLTVFNSRARDIGMATFRWEVEEDLVDFPVVSQSQWMTLRWVVKTQSSGRLVLALRSRPTGGWDWPFPDFQVKNTTVHHNQLGVVTRHYNQPSNEYLDVFFRYRWQKILMYGVTFQANTKYALHVPSITKYHELYLPTFDELQYPHRMAEIVYSIEACHFTENGGGVVGEHNHVEFSNNVWIWQVGSNLFDHNTEGGFVIELPQVNLMHQEVFNHSVDVNDTVFEYNENFEFIVDGFYCNSSVARNRFQYNTCKKGCILFSGTEKDLEISDNEIYDNQGRFIMEINMNSHTPYTRWVDARMMYNNFQRNQMSNQDEPFSSPGTYTVGVKGLQNITINRNLFRNYMHYELLAGQSSSLLENYLDVTQNYWGTQDQQEILDKIFDFDDWNNFAIAEYHPFLLYGRYDSEESMAQREQAVIDLSQPLGGRIESSITLTLRDEPYVVKSDVTVMPNAALIIEAGVEIQFYPNVGILVLGQLTAKGYPNERIRMAPIDKNNVGRVQRDNREKRQAIQYPVDSHDVKLNGGELDNEGFIEFYNSTERRWTLICDQNFNDKTAQVACRTMGMESSNVLVVRSMYYDHFVLGYPIMHDQKVEWFWRHSFICDGTESNLDQCRYRINDNVLSCMEKREYVFVKCGERNLAENYDYWGNIRFSTPEFEDNVIGVGYSVLDYVDIYGAGILHGEYSAALEAVYRTPQTSHVRITNCAWNAYDFIAPKGPFLVDYNVIENNNGYGIGGLVLNGESRYEVEQSSFEPLVESSIPYNVFGLVRMCTSEKLIFVADRLLLYHKYTFETIDCVKVIQSKERHKQIAIRFLQLNLFNDTFFKNSVEMFNGQILVPELKIGEVTANSSARAKSIKYETNLDFDTMAIRMVASPAHGDYGFIAEVVTLPFSPQWETNLGTASAQRIVNTAMNGNARGGFMFKNVGESNPPVVIESNRVENGGQKILNFTSPSVMSLYVQNSKMVTVANNFISHNGGGLYIETDTNSRTTALYSNITNNVIAFNTHGEVMHIEGHHYQGFEVRNNYIAHNDGDHHNTLAFFGVHLNFTANVVYANRAQTIVNASVPERVAISQRFVRNAFYDNVAFAANKTTIFVGSAKHLFRDNFLQNWWNVYELVTYNMTRFEEGLEFLYPDLQAEYNWWGSGNPSFIAGRIWDQDDDENLIEVNFMNYYAKNDSLLEGLCHPGWRMFKNKCYLYMGGVLPFQDAINECKSLKSQLAWAPKRDIEHFLGELVSGAQFNYQEYWRVWVHDDWREKDKCTALVGYRIEQHDCNRLQPFICERDPYVVARMNWKPIIISVSVVGGFLVLIIILIVFAVLKSRNRTNQRLERRTSLRASMRASKQSMFTNKHLTSGAPSTVCLDDSTSTTSGYKRRRPPLSRVNNGMLDISGATTAESSCDIDKMQLSSHRPPSPAASQMSNARMLDSSSYFDSDLLDYYPHRLENEIAHIMPSGGATRYPDSGMRNRSYDEASIDRSRVPRPAPRRPNLSRPYDPGSTDGTYIGRPAPRESAM